MALGKAEETTCVQFNADATGVLMPDIGWTSSAEIQMNGYVANWCVNVKSSGVETDCAGTPVALGAPQPPSEPE